MIALEELKRLEGHRFPGGSVTIEPWQAWLLNDIVLSPTLPDGIAHPIWAYMAGMFGMGVSITDLFDFMQASAADGPMLGEFSLSWHEPLRVGAQYRVRGGIDSIVRKSGRRAGTFDIQSYAVEICDGERVVAVSRNALVYPRGGGERDGAVAAKLARVVQGERLPEFVVESVDPEKMKTLAALLHDPNPIHWDVAEVRRLGLGEHPVNQGPTSISYVLNMLLNWAGHPAVLREFRVRCLANAFGGDCVRAGGEVLARSAGGTECAVWLDRADGMPILAGSATVRAPDPNG